MLDLPERLRVGIVSDNVLQRHRLQEACTKFALRAAFSGTPERLLDYANVPELELWLVTLEDDADHAALFEHLLEKTKVPALFGIDIAPKPGGTEYFHWERRLRLKLEQQLGPIEEFDSEASLAELDSAPSRSAAPLILPEWIPPAEPGRTATQVWILGASLGGPAAVKAFLDHLPASLPVGLIYAQHIDTQFTDVLIRVLGRHAHYRLVRAQSGMRISHGDVVVLPGENEWIIDSDGRLLEKETPWPGPYRPSIDQVLLNIHAYYGDRCNAVIFSGMGNDGAISAPRLAKSGCRIWAQSGPECCESSMPDSVMETGCTSFNGSPETLARELVKTIAESCLLSRKHQRMRPEDVNHER
jgi:chemosensory pili system protein ChpB (putative protein-glutamate methylesterase)